MLAADGIVIKDVIPEVGYISFVVNIAYKQDIIMRNDIFYIKKIKFVNDSVLVEAIIRISRFREQL